MLKKCQYGDLVKCKDNRLYYIYGEYRKELLAIRVYSGIVSKKGVKKIKIQNNLYYTLFEKYTINKSVDISIKKVATQEEKDYINKYRTIYFKIK